MKTLFQKAWISIFVLFSLVTSISAIAQEDAETEALIENAMSAAPTTISQDATIFANEIDDEGKFIVLREGTNGWYCQPDLEGTPTNDPTCFDDVWLEFTYTLLAGEEPVITRLGMSYMLQGGSDASNIDPFVLEPEEGAEWVITPPHIMLLVPGLDVEQFGTDHTAGRPYVMWAGTPYQHIMMPVAEGEMAMDH